jgi:hypothetical protein
MKYRNNIIRILSLLLLLSLLTALGSCENGDGDATGDNITKLSFKAASGYEYLKSLNGTTVTISGYMATSSPVDGSFMFLMNLPYQSCPFCVPNTSQLSNTMEIYPKKGDTFTYTAQAIKVVGTLVVAENENEPFTDMYGYEFNYKIVDATYTVIKAEELSADMVLWQKIAGTDVVNDIYKMYDYVNFLCAWNTYQVNSYTNEKGETVPGYYLYPSDAEKYLYNEGAQYNYGSKEGYFDAIVAKIESIDPTAFADLVANVRKAEALAQKAIGELENKQYTSEYKYVEKFGREDYVYTLNKGAELAAEMNTVYTEFSNWLGSWEM